MTNIIEVPDIPRIIKISPFRLDCLTFLEAIKKVKHITYVPILHIGLLFLLCFPANAQINTSIERLPLETAMMQSTSNYILQDQSGFLWFATGQGLNRYDGYTLKNFRNVIGDKTSLSHDDIAYMVEDTLGFIWIVTYGTGGLNKFDPNTETFIRYQNIPGDSTSISSNELISVNRDRSGNIWVCARNALNRVCYKGNGQKTSTCFKRYYNPADITSFSMVYENRDGKIMLFADKLYYFDDEEEKFLETKVTFLNNDTTSYSVNSITEDENGNLWLGTSIVGIQKLNYNQETGDYTLADLDSQLAANIPLNKCLLTRDKHNRIWIGTQTDGLFMYNEKTQDLDNFVLNECDLNSLSENTIQSLFIDRSGILWIGTFSQGINKIDLNRKNFYHYRSIPGDENSLSGNVISTIHSIDPKELWVGHDLGGGVDRLIFNNNDKFKIINYRYNPDNDHSIGSDNVLSLWQRRNGNVWVGTTGNIITIIAPEEPFSKRKPEIKRLSHAGWPFVIFEDSEELMWVGSWGNGLSRYNEKTGFEHLKNNPNDPNSICDNVVWAISEDNSANLWIGGRGKGVSILLADEKKKDNPKFINFKHDENDPNTLSSNFINVICQDSKGTMWIGTAKGLDKVVSGAEDISFSSDNNKLKIKSYHITDGLPSEQIVGIVEGNDDELWLSTSNGISKFNTVEEVFTNYNRFHGLQNNEFWHNAYFGDDKGRIYFGGNKGFNAFYPDSIFPNSIIPEIAITDMKLFNKDVHINERINDDIILTKSINSTDEIRLSHKNNVISFEFAALHFAQPAMNEYEYFLEGFDKDWNNIGNKRDITFTNLNPGEYFLHIKGSNNDGIWSQKAKVIKIIILPPWWKTWWFKILSVLVVLTCGYLFFRYRTNQLRRRKIILARLVEKRTTQLEQANTILEEKQKEISLQNEELQVQKESLQEVNRILEEQSEEIESQNNELTRHRNHLEHLVEDRTSELVAALKKAEESDRLKSIFLSNMSHEIRTPMNAIVGFSSVLNDPDYSEEERQEIISIIRKNSESLLILINDILEMSEIQANQLNINNRLVNVIDIFKELKASFNLQIKQKELELIIEPGQYADTYNCPVDPVRFRQVLSNLISNAIKFTEKGFVKFGISEVNQESVIFFVQDTGIGIPADAGDSIFNRFRKIESTNTRFYQGIGLGLSISYSIVKAMKGNIWYESELEKGTTFYFSIPADQEIISTSSTKEVKEQELPNFEGKRILIVEDEETNYQLLEFFLSKTDAKLTWAKNGIEALELFKKHQNYDLILMDIKLPLMDGTEVTKLIRKTKPDQKIVAQTAYVKKDEKTEHMIHDFDGYLEKPITLEELINVLNENLPSK